MPLLLSILAFNLIIIVHELGHFVVAKLFKIQVHEFSLFFGPKIFSFKIGETMYSLRMIPVLAYVKLEGEDKPVQNDRSFSEKSVLTRMAVIAAGPIANILLATLILIITYSIQGYESTKIQNVLEGSPAYEAGIKAGDELVEYDNRRVFEPFEASLFLFASEGKSVDVKVIRNGKEEKLKIKPLVAPENRFMLGVEFPGTYDKNSNVIENVLKDQASAKAGIKSGDRIVGMNGKSIASRTDVVNYLAGVKDNQSIKLDIERDGKRISTIEVMPIKSKSAASYELGFVFAGAIKGSFVENVKQSFIGTYAYTRASVYSIVFLAQGKFSPKEMSGPVGIVATMNEVVQQVPTFMDKLLNLLRISVLITIGLGIANLLPIPPADGSKLILLAVEAIRRKPLPEEKEAYIMAAGFVFMMILFVVILFNDIAKIFTGAGA